MQVKDIMNRDVVTVRPRTPLKNVARLLLEHRFSGVPVVDDDGTVLGVVSEGDIILKERAPAGRTSLLGRVLDVGTDAQKHDARDAADAMTTPAVTIRPARSIAEAAALMHERKVNRLPVVDAHGVLVGIVTRADLLRAFVRDDDEIEREIWDDVVLESFSHSRDRFHVQVERGEVTLEGRVADAGSAEMLVRAVERVPGVVGVRNRITWPTG